MEAINGIGTTTTTDLLGGLTALATKQGIGAFSVVLSYEGTTYAPVFVKAATHSRAAEKAARFRGFDV